MVFVIPIPRQQQMLVLGFLIGDEKKYRAHHTKKITSGWAGITPLHKYSKKENILSTRETIIDFSPRPFPPPPPCIMRTKLFFPALVLIDLSDNTCQEYKLPTQKC